LFSDRSCYRVRVDTSEPTIAQLEEQGYTHIDCRCHGCGYIVQTPFQLIRSLYPLLPVDRMTISELGGRMRCGRCGGRRPDQVSAWRQSMAQGHTRLT
jgi:hypothetical protein